MEKARDRACIYSASPKFWSWIEDASNYMVTDEAGAAEYIRLEIGATSRGMIATNPEIYQRYIERVEMPFQQWAGLMPEMRA
jgi:hypothetical protein